MDRRSEGVDKKVSEVRDRKMELINVKIEFQSAVKIAHNNLERLVLQAEDAISELNSLLQKVPPAILNPIQATSIGNIGISATKSDACTPPPAKKIAVGYTYPTKAIAPSGQGAFVSGFNPPAPVATAQVITPTKFGFNEALVNP
jgi:hypothetical protein